MILIYLFYLCLGINFDKIVLALTHLKKVESICLLPIWTEIKPTTLVHGGTT